METIRVKTVDFSPVKDNNQDNFIVGILRKNIKLLYPIIRIF